MCCTEYKYLAAGGLGGVVSLPSPREMQEGLGSSLDIDAG